VTVWAKAPGRSRPAEPFALVERVGSRGLVLTGLNDAARALGLRWGQSHADACAIAPDLVSHPAEPERAREALRKLALWAERWSPAVSVDADRPQHEGLFLDVTGAAHLWGGEAEMLADLRRRLEAADVEARVAMAGTPGAAWALARFTAHQDPIAPPGQEKAALAGLPVEGLRLSEKAVRLLGRFGLRRIGDLYPIPRAGLARRFRGPEGLEVVANLDRALGLVGEALKPETAPAAYRAYQVFFDPIIVGEGAAERAADLTRDLCAQLERDGMGARKVVVTGFRVDGRTTGFEIALGAPSRKPDHLLRLLREKGWERLDLGFGIDALMVSAAVAQPLAAVQADSEAGPAAADAAARAALVDRLVARLGDRAVGRPVLRESWIPERSEGMESALAAAPVPSAKRGGVSQERPLLLLNPPEPIEALADLPDGAPARFVWRRVARRVARSSGPERLSPEWWRPAARSDRPARTRDYYKLEDGEGGRYWVFREGLYGREDAERVPTWWMHGVFG